MFDYKRHLIRLPAKCIVLGIYLFGSFGAIDFLFKSAGIILSEKWGQLLMLAILGFSMHYQGKFWTWLNK